MLQSYEEFKALVYQREAVLLQQKEPSYCTRFRACETLRLEHNQILKECNPLLSSQFQRFVDLMESLYEVGYYWKRLTETARLLEVNVPDTPLQQLNEASWFIYNLDFYWHSVYGLQERIRKLLAILKRIYRSPTPEEAKVLEKSIEAWRLVKTQATKVIRDPIAHYRSQGVEGWRNDHQWEVALLRDHNADFIEAYDKNYLQHKDFYLEYIRMWVPQYGETLSILFDRLCAFSLERLEPK